MTSDVKHCLPGQAVGSKQEHASALQGNADTEVATAFPHFHSLFGSYLALPSGQEVEWSQPITALLLSRLS